MTDLPADAKAALRTQMQTKRTAIAVAERLAASQSVKLQFIDHPYLTYAKSFAGYYAIRQELDVLPIFNHMQRYGKAMALPRMDKASGLLRFLRWQPGEALEDDEHGIKCPQADAPEIIPEVVLVPLLAFDQRGVRLGYGGGWYDRTLAELRRRSPAPMAFGVAYSSQEMAALPAEAHDARLDGILTELGVSMFTG